MIRVCRDNVFELYSQGKYYGYIRIEDLVLGEKKVGNSHFYITRFSHNILNRMRRDEGSLMNYIEKAGYFELVSFIDVTCVKHGDINLWTKFVKLIGFDEPKLFTRRTT